MDARLETIKRELADLNVRLGEVESQINEETNPLTKITLRDEKDKLRDEQDKLRDEQDAHERLSRGLLGLRGWLQQELPPHPLDLVTGNSNVAYGTIIPNSVVSWEGFEEDVDEYVDEYVALLDDNDRVHPSLRSNFFNSVGGVNEGASRSVLEKLLHPLTETFVDAGVAGVKLERVASFKRTSEDEEFLGEARRELKGRDAQALCKIIRRYPDVVIAVHGKAVVVIEIKSSAHFRASIEEDIPNLTKVYNNPEEYTGQKSHWALRDSVLQLFDYLVTANVGYGVLSSVDATYFVCLKKGKVHSDIQISEGFKWESRILKALHYIISKSMETEDGYWDTLKNSDGQQPKGDGNDHEKDHEKDKESEEENGKDDGYCPPRTRVRSGNNSRTVKTRSMSTSKVDGALESFPVERMHLEEVPFAYGWTGVIFRGRIHKLVVALKFGIVGSLQAEAIKNEARAYLKLKKHWGHSVPKLILHGTTLKGHVVFLATELFDGFHIGHEPLTEDVKAAAMVALNHVHSCGILHKDIRPENILVGKEGVRLIDFGFSRSIATNREAEEECEQLRNIFDGRKSLYENNKRLRVKV